MMQLRLLVVLILVVISCVDARKSRFAARWRDKKKGLRGGKKKAEPEPEAAMPKPAATMPKPAVAVMPAETKEKMAAEKQTVSNLPTKIGDAPKPEKHKIASAMPPPKVPGTVKEPPVKGAGMPPPGMGMYHAPGMGPPPGMGGPGGSAPVSVVGASAYAGFWCGPKSTPDYDGLKWVEEHCRELPICKYKTVPDGAAGKKPVPELVDGQGDCMRRSDPKDGLSEKFCNKDEESYPYVLNCPCANLNSGKKECQAW